jgi:hypothetical protein
MDCDRQFRIRQGLAALGLLAAPFVSSAQAPFSRSQLQTQPQQPAHVRASSTATTSSMARVTIKGNRLYAGGTPYFLSTNFLTTGAPYPGTLPYFSERLTDEDRAAMLNALKAGGYNAIFIYTLNGDDVKSRSVSPYTADTPIGKMSGDFDDAKLNGWRTEMETMINDYGLRPVIWLFPDDSPNIAKASEAEHKRYIREMVRRFDDLPVLWVLALEADEYWKDKAYVNRLGSYLQGLARNPVGIHQLPDRVDYMQAAWVDFGMYQYGFDQKDDPRYWEKLYAETQQRMAQLRGKPFIASEYDDMKDKTDTAEGLRIGLATAFAGAAGVGNGAPPDLDEFMAALPDRMKPSRQGTSFTLTGGGVTATANLGDVNTLQYRSEKAAPQQ